MLRRAAWGRALRRALQLLRHRHRKTAVPKKPVSQLRLLQSKRAFVHVCLLAFLLVSHDSFVLDSRSVDVLTNSYILLYELALELTRADATVAGYSFALAHAFHATLDVLKAELEMSLQALPPTSEAVEYDSDNEGDGGFGGVGAGAGAGAGVGTVEATSTLRRSREERVRGCFAQRASLSRVPPHRFAFPCHASTSTSSMRLSENGATPPRHCWTLALGCRPPPTSTHGVFPFFRSVLPTRFEDSHSFCASCFRSSHTVLTRTILRQLRARTLPGQAEASKHSLDNLASMVHAFLAE